MHLTALPTLRRPRLALLAFLMAVATGLAGWQAAIDPPVAFAHTSVKSKRPAAGGKAKTNITLVAAVFSGSVRSARLTVTGPGSKTVSKGTKRDPRQPKRFQANLASGLKAGSYKVKCSWTATDGHKQTASWSFSLSA